MKMSRANIWQSSDAATSFAPISTRAATSGLILSAAHSCWPDMSAPLVNGCTWSVASGSAFESDSRKVW